LARDTISNSTRRTYVAAERLFKEYCYDEDIAPEASNITPARAANFIAWMVHETNLQGASIANYKSGIRYWWLEQTRWREGLNPFDSVVVNAVLSGVKRNRLDSDREARACRPVTTPIGPGLLSKLKPFLMPMQDTMAPDNQLIIWAAACLAACALLRPNEFLGSDQWKERHLKHEQIIFHRRTFWNLDPDLDVWKISLPGTVYDCCPSRLTISLKLSKADQLGKNADLIVSDPLAVRAMWVWCSRRACPAYGMKWLLEEPLFKPFGGRPLSIKVLCSTLSQAIAKFRGGASPLVTGRCFRRGGNSELIMLGKDRQYIQAIGRWKSRAMPITYADPAVLAHRAAAAAAGLMAPL